MALFSRFILTALAVAFSFHPVYAQGFEGTWNGNLELGGPNNLKLVFHISMADSTVTMDSPAQGAFGITAKTLFLSSDSLSISIPKIQMSYSGVLRYGIIDGTFTQGPVKLPLKLSRDSSEIYLYRPQTPKPPFPYITQDVTISNTAGGSSLAGTLTLPKDWSVNTPVIVMVSGSGLQNRDEEVFDHKPFAVIADFLARNGVASLRYDDRNIGSSTGEVINATTADFASDTQAVLNWLRDNKHFKKAGILGHSEGGLIAYMLGAKAGGPDFIISIAGPSIKGVRTIAYQNRMAMIKTGVADDIAADAGKAIEKALTFKLNHTDSLSLSDSQLQEIYPEWNQNPTSRQLAASLRQALEARSDNVWMMFFLNYDPAADLRALKIPALIIYGEKDRQVPPSLNYEPACLYAPGATINVYPGLNHLMQPADTGYVEEYANISQTISETVLADILTFIQNLP